MLADLPEEARVLCVGVGTGAELGYLARVFPRWRFTALDPSGVMLEICRHRAEEEGIVERCAFFEGYVDSLPADSGHDAATCFLVSQFILKPEVRTAFFRAIADRLKPGGLLVCSDLAADAGKEYDELLPVWWRVMAAGEATPDGLDRLRATYARDVAILPPKKVASVIETGGFETPISFYQAGLIHAWYARNK